MKIKVAGFMLIELALYCLLSSFLAILFCTITIRQINSLKKVCSDALQECSYYCALEKVITKIQALPADRSLWKVISSELLVVKTASEDIGFLFEKPNIYYLYGSYDQINQRWIKKRKELAVANLTQSSWRIVMNNTFPQIVRAVIWDGTHNSNKIERWICPGRSVIS